MSGKYEKSEAGEIVVKRRFAQWFENFWYYYKWHTIIIVFFLTVGIICFAQCAASKNSNDLVIAYAGGFSPDKEQNQLICEVFGSVVPEEEDGSAHGVMLNYFAVFTEEEAKILSTNEKGETNTNGVRELLQRSMTNIDQFSQFSKTGKAAVWLVSEYVYESLHLNEISMPLSNLYGEDLPEARYDDYAVRLSETDLYRYYGALRELPPDTLVVMPAKLILGVSRDAETYGYFCQVFRAIVDFRAP